MTHVLPNPPLYYPPSMTYYWASKASTCSNLNFTFTAELIQHFTANFEFECVGLFFFFFLQTVITFCSVTRDSD